MSWVHGEGARRISQGHACSVHAWSLVWRRRGRRWHDSLCYLCDHDRDYYWLRFPGSWLDGRQRHPERVRRGGWQALPNHRSFIELLCCFDCGGSNLDTLRRETKADTRTGPRSATTTTGEGVWPAGATSYSAPQ